MSVAIAVTNNISVTIDVAFAPSVKLAVSFTSTVK